MRFHKHALLLLVLVFSTPGFSLAVDPTPLKIPTTVQVEPQDYVIIRPDTPGKTVVWRLGPGASRGLSVLPAELSKDPKVFVATAKNNPGKYCVYACTCVGDVPSEIVSCEIEILGDPTPPTPPVPPTPPTPPTPPVPPAPIPTGKRVLIIYETSELPKMNKDQKLVLFSRTVRDYLNSHCSKDADGKTYSWRIYDKDVDLAGESQVWGDAMKRPRTALPWLIVSNGTTGFEGPLPANVDLTVTLLKKYLGD